MDIEDPNRDRLLMSRRWLTELKGLEPQDGGFLLTLIMMAATARAPEIPVSAANVAPHIKHSDMAQFPACFAALKLKRLVKETRPGVYGIAPGLWKVGPWDPADEEFFPFPDD